jgi:hypothetical protein
MRHGAYDVHGALKGSKLIATVRAKSPVVNAYADHFDTVTSLGLGYCQVLVETHGGALEVQGFGTDSDPTITLSFPVEKTARDRGGKFTPPTKAAKSRRIAFRSEE